MVSEEIIKEAASRGIVPGARIKCADHSDCEGIGVVSEYHKWRNESFGYVVCGTDQEDDELYAKTGDDQWAEVMENTNPTVKELTTEEKLAKAVRLLDRVTTGHENLMKACGHDPTHEYFTHTG